jgi:hypothetical protein
MKEILFLFFRLKSSFVNHIRVFNELTNYETETLLKHEKILLARPAPNRAPNMQIEGMSD